MSNSEVSTETIVRIDDAVPQPPARPWPRSRLLNVWVDNLSMAQLMDKLDEGFVCTLNPDQVSKRRKASAMSLAETTGD